MFFDLYRTFPTLSPNEVHLWLACLTQPAQKGAEFWQSLNAEERERADKFVMPQHRERFIAARGILRQLLAGYLNCLACEIKFVVGEFGKMELAKDISMNKSILTHNIKFNLSHAKEYALFAFSCERALGVDIEYLRADMDVQSISQRFFSSAEAAAILSLPEKEQNEPFFNCWTRKEAFIKAIGKGLYYPLHDFDVDVKSILGDARVALNIRDQELQDKTWSLFSVTTLTGYAAALVVEGAVEQKKIVKLGFGD